MRLLLLAVAAWRARVAGSLVMLDGYRGPSSHIVSSDEVRGAVREIIKTEIDALRAELSPRSDADTASALAEVRKVTETVRADSASLRQEMAEAAAAVDERITHKFAEAAARAQAERDKVVEQLNTRIDKVVNVAAANATRLEETARTQRDELDAKLVELSNASMALLHELTNETSALDDEFRRFTEGAHNWSFHIEASLHALEESTASLEARANETDAHLYEFETMAADYVEAASNRSDELRLSVRELSDKFTTLNATSRATDERLNRTEQSAAQFVADAYNWTQNTESHVKDVEDKLGQLESQTTASLARIDVRANESEAFIAYTLNASIEWATEYADRVASVAAQHKSLSALVVNQALEVDAKIETWNANLSDLVDVRAGDLEAKLDKTSAVLEQLQRNVTAAETGAAVWAASTKGRLEEMISTSLDEHANHLRREMSNATTAAYSHIHDLASGLSALNGSLQDANRNAHAHDEAASLWAGAMEDKFDALSNATLSLEIAINATVTAVDAEVAARRTDSADAQKLIDEVRASVLSVSSDTNQTSARLASTTSTLETRLDALAASLQVELQSRDGRLDNLSATHVSFDSRWAAESALLAGHRNASDEQATALAERIDVLVINIENVSANLSATFTTSLQQAVGDLEATIHANSTQQWDQMNATNTRLNGVVAALENLTANSSAQFDANDAATARVAARLDDVDDRLQLHVADLQMVSSGANQTSAMLANATSALEGRLDELAGSFQVGLQSRDERLENLSSTQVSFESLWATESALSAELRNASDQRATAFEARLDALAASVQSETSNLSAKFVLQLQHAVDNLEAALDNSTTHQWGQTNATNTRLDIVAAALEDLTLNSTAQFDENAVATARIEARLGEVDAHSQWDLANLNSSLDNWTAALANAIDETARNQSALVETTSRYILDSYESALDEHARNASSQLSISMAQLETRLNQTALLANKTQTSLDNVSLSLESITSELHSHVNYTTLREHAIADTVASWASTFEANCSRAVTDLGSALNESHARLSDDVIQLSDGIHNLNNRTSTLEARSTAAEIKAAASEAEVSANQNSSAAFVAAAREWASNVEAAMEASSDDVSGNFSAFEVRLRALERGTADLNETMEARMSSLDDSLAAHAREVSRWVDESGNTTRAALQEASRSTLLHVDEKFHTANMVVNSTMQAFERAVEMLVLGSRRQDAERPS